mmetsp:Transcript_34913/g.104469  ORF Transcript_34913/g.104469 Transcript_34913/m.104469 type:complete len:145 (+) Transcript_34913:59-493(+)|eukprot:CAMPEP_0175266512 /NCGR_PEP_ID=MMETSP0093-20121207/43371_1 /TAXON_ID=311494 /ORGANISM="Alexandrium monilatum, Strain CCMP3105" /LENGTH=144 /DNA_ID=CAMNT_0016561119 /DNA_START=58 /DNA_END=492 /DNA_ORIENTATION=+
MAGIEAWQNHYIERMAAVGVNLGTPKEKPVALPAAPVAMVPKEPEKDLDESLKDMAALLRDRKRMECVDAGYRAQVGVGSLGPEFKDALARTDDVLANCDGRRWVSKLRVLPVPGKRVVFESTWARSMKKSSPLAQANRDVYHV